MNNVVIFTSNNARIIKVTDRELFQYAERTDTAINPDFEALTGHPPHFWKLLPDKSIGLLSGPERKERVLDIEARGADNDVTKHPIARRQSFLEHVKSKFKKLQNWAASLFRRLYNAIKSNKEI